MRELTVGKNIVANTLTTIYTVPKGCKAICTLLHISNSTGSGKTVTATWYDKSNNANITVIHSHSLNSGNNNYIQFLTGRLVMDEYDYITVISETGSTMSVILTMEIDQTTSYQHVS
jgi:mitochondrial fission protein ELM1